MDIKIELENVEAGDIVKCSNGKFYMVCFEKNLVLKKTYVLLDLKKHELCGHLKPFSYEKDEIQLYKEINLDAVTSSKIIEVIKNKNIYIKILKSNN